MKLLVAGLVTREEKKENTLNVQQKNHENHNCPPETKVIPP